MLRRGRLCPVEQASSLAQTLHIRPHAEAGRALPAAQACCIRTAALARKQAVALLALWR